MDKLCAKCKENKLIDDFYILKSGKSHCWCKLCCKEYKHIQRQDPDDIEHRKQYMKKYCSTPEYQEINNERSREFSKSKKGKKYKYIYRLKYYQLTEEKFNEILKSQGNSCAICGSEDPRGMGTWHIDHDHRCCPTDNYNPKTCGKCTRGLLCNNCNLGLGYLKDNIEVLQKSINYLNRGYLNFI